MTKNNQPTIVVVPDEDTGEATLQEEHHQTRAKDDVSPADTSDTAQPLPGVHHPHHHHHHHHHHHPRVEGRARSGSLVERRSGSLGSRTQLTQHLPELFTSYPSARNLSGRRETWAGKQVAFLAIQPSDVHEIVAQNAAGQTHLNDEESKKATSYFEKHPRLMNSIYRKDLSLKYELLVPQKKETRTFIDSLSRIFSKTTGIITQSNKKDAERLSHLPELVVVQNDFATGGSKQMPHAIFSPSNSVTHLPDLPRSRLSTNTSQATGEYPHFPHQDTSSIGKASSHLMRRLNGKDESLCFDDLTQDTPPVETGTGAESNSLLSRGKRLLVPGIGGRTNSISAQSIGFVLSALPPPTAKSPPKPNVDDRPDSPHIDTPTRTAESLSEASTPDRYRENASALYLMQPISVNTFRRLKPSEAMQIRYIDRTSSLSLCVSGSDQSQRDDDRSTVRDDLEGGSFGSSPSQSSSSMMSGEHGEYGGNSMIMRHKRALVYQQGEWLINNPDQTVYTLLYTKHTKVGMKDFAVDFRAQMDTDRLLRDAVVILDSHESHIYKIIMRLVSEVVDKDFEATGRGSDSIRKNRCKDEALRRLFVDKSVTVLSRCIQGACLSEMFDDTLDIAMASDQIWMCAFASLHDVKNRHVAFCRTSSPVNMGHISEELKFVVLIMTPTVEKSTKTALETARTFSTLFLDVETRNQLSGALDEQEFRDILTDHACRLHAIQEHPELVRRLTQKRASKVYFKSRCLSWFPGQGIYHDIRSRWPHYKSDYTDGYYGPNTLHKVMSTIFFLYFAVLLPTLAFGVLNDSNTAGKIGVEKHIFAQVFGGLAFGIFGGQPLLVIMTTAPLGLYMRILYSIANQFQVDFFAFYSCIGLWNCFFLCIYALMNTSCLTNLCTRTIQDIFEMFALFAFVVDGLTELMHNFGEHYFSEACSRQSGHEGMTGVWALTGQLEGRSTMSRTMPTTTPMREETTGTGLGFLNYLLPEHIQEKRDVDYFVGSGMVEELGMTSPSVATSTTPNINTASSTIVQLIQEVLNVTLSTTSTTTHPTVEHSGPTLHDDDPNLPPHLHDENECRRDRALLYLLLMLATWWSSLRLHSFAKTPYLNKKVRDFLADYSLPLSIIGVSVGGRLFFGDVQLEVFTIYDYTPERAQIEHLPLWCVLVCCGVGFVISLLFFFDTTITNSVVCRPTNKLKKGTTYDYDLLIVALINGFLSLFALPWLYPTTPQSPLHLLGLADVEERVDAGHVYQSVVRVRETRLTTIITSIMIGLSLFMLPYPLAYISRPVLNGLFLYMAAMSIHDNQLMERIMLIFTEQTAYPPHHYIRTVPQRQLHLITIIQIFQLIIICGMGLYGHNIYVEMLFPIVLCLMFPVRHSLMPKIIDIKYLESLEGLKSSTITKRAAPGFNSEL